MVLAHHLRFLPPDHCHLHLDWSLARAPGANRPNAAFSLLPTPSLFCSSSLLDLVQTVRDSRKKERDHRPPIFPSTLIFAHPLFALSDILADTLHKELPPKIALSATLVKNAWPPFSTSRSALSPCFVQSSPSSTTCPRRPQPSILRIQQSPRTVSETSPTSCF